MQLITSFEIYAAFFNDWGGFLKIILIFERRHDPETIFPYPIHFTKSFFYGQLQEN